MKTIEKIGLNFETSQPDVKRNFSFVDFKRKRKPPVSFFVELFQPIFAIQLLTSTVYLILEISGLDL